jgi:formamidopyrimidine-DNA glycosylase
MPELPEVEASRENLSRWLGGKRIARARVLDPTVVRRQDRRRVESALSGARVRAVGRRGKYLLFDLGRRGRAFAHLGMTGKFVLRGRGEADPKGARAALDLAGGKRVVFQDVRRFGGLGLLEGEALAAVEALGVDALAREFTPRRLQELLGSARLPVKLFLMDQSRIAGLGNIHAAEALFIAGLDPRRSAAGLDRGEATRLHRAIRRTLRKGLEEARGPEIAYVEEPGTENPFRVYGKEGERCPRCGGRIARIPQGGRSTFFCPRCQTR